MFILDTGMQDGLITTDLAREITTVTPRPGDSLRGLNGVVRNLSVTGPVALGVSGYSGKIAEMTAMDDLSGFAPGGIVQVPGFLGYDVLRHVVLSIDYRDGLVQVRPSP